MSVRLDLELVQDKYTNFVLYDASDRTNVQYTWIPLADISSVELIFKSTSEHLTEDMVYVLDMSKKAIHYGNEPFTGYNFSGYDCSEELVYKVNGVEYTITMDTNVTNITDLVAKMNSARPLPWGIYFHQDGYYIVMDTIATGSTAYFEIVGGALATRLGLRPGIYRGNDLLWGSPLLLQKDFYQYIYAEDLKFAQIPDGQWDVEINVMYNNGHSIIDVLYQTSYTEFSYKLTEIYRAKMFEYIAKNFKDFEVIEQRAWTELEKTMYSILQYDAVYKAFKAAIDVGNSRTANTTLSYLINYRVLNPIA